MKNNGQIEEAFQYCEGIAKSHYENFPVGWFIPKKIRRYVFAVYAFARTADDFSDEAAYDGERLDRLTEFEQKLDHALSGESEELLFTAVAKTVEETSLPQKLLKDLLTAFRLDVTKNRYRDFGELESYCVYSANPIGRMVLHLYGIRDPKLLGFSDRICTAIQLVNHWQDVAIDLVKGRVYLPEEDLRRFGYSYEDLSQRKINDSFQALMRFEIARTRSLFYEGKPLLEALERRLRWQVSLMWLGPMKILERIEASHYDIFHSRPSLSRKDFLTLLIRVPRVSS